MRHGGRLPLSQFDYLKSLEIEEKINKIRWCHQGGSNAKFLLSTNDKAIKLWKARAPYESVGHPIGNPCRRLACVTCALLRGLEKVRQGDGLACLAGV